MQGVYFTRSRPSEEQRGFPRRPKSRAAMVRVLEADGAEALILEATSHFGNEYGGLLSDAPTGSYNVVGPDPHRRRNWYATIHVDNGKVTVK